MKTEELLIKRYKVESPFPTMERYNIKVGDILTDDGVNAVRNQNYDAIFAFEWESFPLIFRELFWYEERDVSEMPEYVKIIYENGKEIIQPYSKQEFVNEAWAKENLIQYFPSTLEEYTNYINQQQCTHS